MSIDAALGRLGNKSGVCTSSTRPTNPYEGQLIYETDTNRTLVYDNAAWVVIANASATGFPTSLDTNTVDSIAALQAKVGVDGSAVTSSLDYKVALAFGEAWQSASYGTNFTDYGSIYPGVQFRREADTVRVRGLAKATASVGVTEVIFTLPTGYRPPDDLVLATVCASGSTAPAIAVIEVKPTGIVMLGGGMSMVNGNYITLNFSFSIS